MASGRGWDGRRRADELRVRKQQAVAVYVIAGAATLAAIGGGAFVMLRRDSDTRSDGRPPSVVPTTPNAPTSVVPPPTEFVGGPPEDVAGPPATPSPTTQAVVPPAADQPATAGLGLDVAPAPLRKVIDAIAGTPEFPSECDGLDAVFAGADLSAAAYFEATAAVGDPLMTSLLSSTQQSVAESYAACVAGDAEGAADAWESARSGVSLLLERQRELEGAS